MQKSQLGIMMLRVLDALFHAKKTTLAAARLGITQPAISAYLKQLRHMTGDELFIRTRKGLEPTDFCHAYQKIAKETLLSIERLEMIKKTEFNPATISARFSVAIPFVKGRMIFDGLGAGLAQQYPLMRINMLYMSEHDAISGLDAGTIDFYIGLLSEKLEKYYTAKKMLRTEFVVLCSQKSKFFKAGHISKTAYLETPHIKAGASLEPSILDAKFKKLGILQKHLVTVPDVAAEIRLLKQTDYLLLIDRSDVPFIDQEGDFKILKTDFEMPDFDIFAVWHSRRNSDAPHHWYQQRIMQFAKPPSRRIL